MRIITGLVLAVVLVSAGLAWGADVDLAITVQRPLRYHPEAGDFVIENGGYWFNRPLYGPHTAFHIDGGDKPEFALVATAIKDGVLRLGLAGEGGEKWLGDAKEIVTRYRPGSLIYEISDPLLGESKLRLTALSMADAEGFVLRAEVVGAATKCELVWEFGGVTSLRRNAGSVRAGDVITTSNVSSVRAIDEINGHDLRAQLMLTAGQCAEDEVRVEGESFSIRAGAENVGGRVSGGSVVVGDAGEMPTVGALLKSQRGKAPVVVGKVGMGEPVYLVLWRTGAPAGNVELGKLFDAAEAHRKSIADELTVDTPDAFINAIPSAICVAGDGCWQPPTWMHGAVSWHVPLLGWRGAYIGDALGWHDRAEAYFKYWAGRQNTSDDFPTVARPNPARLLAENDGGMLHSNGSIPSTHYDMNLIYIDALFRHLLWTGDRALARQLWPVIQRHLAWEKRCFDRDGLYEGYACIWASDALQYNGGGAAHSTAYNEFHNRMAARVAKWIGVDPTPYQVEADRIHQALQDRLWMSDLGWYAEYQDAMGEKQLHPSAALWTIYHSVDSRVANPYQAWQCMRYVDTSIAHIPVRGPGVPAGEYHVLPESDWMPYEWSLNNVVTAENTHMALAYWEAGRADAGFNLFKSMMLDTMYMGMTPGNLPNLSAYDPYRGETYTDFADPTGITARALVEGMFGVVPDAIAGELLIRPGFPMEWDHAAIKAHDFSYSFKLQDQTETWVIEPKFAQPMRLRLELAARGERVESVQINGQATTWLNVERAIGRPRIEIASAKPLSRYEVSIRWAGQAPAVAVNPASVVQGADFEFSVGPAALVTVFDPQNALEFSKQESGAFKGMASGLVGHRTAFAKVRQGDYAWWLPIEFEIRPAALPTFSWQIPAVVKAKLERVDLSGFFNDKVTRIFLNDYLTPRPATCSLQMPLHGIGEWTGPQYTYAVDDRGLRAAAGKKGVFTGPRGIPFKTPGEAGAKNIIFTSQWDNYPRRVTVPLSGRASHAYFLLAGSTYPMESRMENAQIVVAYEGGTRATLALVNPTNWWPIDKNYRIDSYAFARPEPIPWRVALGTGEVYQPKGEGMPRGGSATVLAMPLDSTKELKSVTLHTEAWEIVVGMMGVTLERE